METHPNHNSSLVEEIEFWENKKLTEVATCDKQVVNRSVGSWVSKTWHLFIVLLVLSGSFQHPLYPIAISFHPPCHVLLGWSGLVGWSD